MHRLCRFGCEGECCSRVRLSASLLCWQSALAAGMVVAVDALEVLHSDVGVDLRGGNIGMAEQALHHCAGRRRAPTMCVAQEWRNMCGLALRAELSLSRAALRTSPRPTGG